MGTVRAGGRVFARVGILLAAALAGAGGPVLGVCGPFTDFTDASFCPFVLEILTLGITTGTTPTTYDPASDVTRLQMAAFLSRTVDRVLQRGSRRAALNQFWTTQAPSNLGTTSIAFPFEVRSDGQDVWVTNGAGSSVFRVRGSDGALLSTWTGADASASILAATGRVFVAGQTVPGRLYRVNPTQAPGVVTTLASTLGDGAKGIAYDGGRIWTANYGGSVSIVTPTVSLPWTVTTVGGFTNPLAALYDGKNVWVTDYGAGLLLKLDSAASVLQTVTMAPGASDPIFDGTNIWVPVSGSNSVVVVRASSGAVVSTLTGNGLTGPYAAAFDGERILVTNFGGGSVSLWKAADLSLLGSFQTGGGSQPAGACSDGVYFWFALQASSQLARF